MDINKIFANIIISINPGIDALIDKTIRNQWLSKAREEWNKSIDDHQILNDLIGLLDNYIESFIDEKWESLSPIGFKNYQASTNGRIKNVNTNKILKCGLDDSGYIRVALSINNISKFKMVHTLVAQIFLENPENKPTVDHVDRKRFNSNIKNLRWATYSEQNYNRSESSYCNVGRTIVQFTKDDDIIKIWNSAAEIQRALGIDARRIIDACRGIRNPTEYNWAYIEEMDHDQDEIWKEIPHPELQGYLASSKGRIMKFDGRILKGSIKKGYYRVGITINGKKEEYRVHRLVASAFYGIHDNLVVNHLNGDRGDNRIGNLEFTTIQGNNQHAYQMGFHKYTKDKRNCPILQLDKINDNIIAEYPNPHLAHLATGANEKAIIQVCKGGHKTSGGFKWIYKSVV